MAETGGGVSTRGGLQGESSNTLPKSARFTPHPSHTQGSTQTLQGDKGVEGETLSSDPDDSDAEENPRPKGKRPEPRPKRRYTIEPGDVAEEILLTETQDGEEAPVESIFAKVQNAGEFIASATSHPEIWCNAVRNLVTSLVAYQETNHEFHRDLLSSRERVAALSQQLKESNQVLQSARASEERLRESRTTNRRIDA